MRFLFGLFGLLALCANSVAADLPIQRKAQPLMVGDIWTGYYVGGHAGWVFDSSLNTDNSVLDAIVAGQRVDPKGSAFGIQFGHMQQYGSVVVGLEGDFSILRARKSATTTVVEGTELPATFATTVSSDMNYVSSFRARLGWLPLENVLLYATAGPALGHVQARVAQTVTVGDIVTPGQVATAESTAFGPSYGAGLQLMLGRNLIARAEWIRYDFNKSSFAFDTVEGGTNVNARLRADVARVGLDYKFSYGQ